jgi:hypothetical protein
MESNLLTILPNLSIGVISVLSLVYITTNFLKHLDSRTRRHEEAMTEREKQLRIVESEVRNNILGQLGQNNQLMAENAKVLERVISHLDRK